MTDRLSKIRDCASPANLREFEESVKYAERYGGPPLTDEEKAALALRRAEIMKGAGK